MSRMVCIVAAVLVLQVIAAVSAGTTRGGKHIADPTARLLAIGFPAELNPQSASDFLRAQFPHLAVNDTQSALGKAEVYRMEVLILSLQERNTADDRKVLKVIRAGFSWCEVCTWVVGHILGDIESDGCSAAEGAFASVCAAIPYVDVVVDVCVQVLEWGCGKLASYIANGITSPASLCNDVFSICGGGSGSSSSAAASSSSS